MIPATPTAVPYGDTLFRATLRKEWFVHRSLLIDYLLAALVAVTVLPYDRPIGFAVLGALLAASLGARIGGDEAMWGTREFVFTRPVARADWFWLRYRIGLLPLVGLLGLFFFADLLGTHRAFLTLFAEPLQSDPVLPFRPVHFLPFAAAVALVYTVAFGAAARERRPEKVLEHRFGACVFGGAMAFMTYVFAALVLRRQLGLLAMPDEMGVDTPAMAATVAGLSAALVFPTYVWGRAGVERIEVEGDGAASTSSSGGVAVAVALVLLILVVLGVIWMSLAVAPEGPVMVENK